MTTAPASPSARAASRQLRPLRSALGGGRLVDQPPQSAYLLAYADLPRVPARAKVIERCRPRAVVHGGRIRWLVGISTGCPFGQVGCPRALARPRWPSARGSARGFRRSRRGQRLNVVQFNIGVRSPRHGQVGGQPASEERRAVHRHARHLPKCHLDRSRYPADRVLRVTSVTEPKPRSHQLLVGNMTVSGQFHMPRS